MRQDFRLALRSLRLRPGSNVIIVSLLGLGIAACTVVFSLVRGLLLRPLDFPAPERLVRFYASQETSIARLRVTEGAFYDLRRDVAGFETVIGARNMGMPITDADEALNPLMREISMDWHQTLGARAAVGRLFETEDHQPGVRRVILSYGLWQSLYGGDPTVIDRTIELAYEAYEIVGVLPAGFRNPTFPQLPALWLPLAEPSAPDRRRTNLVVLGRMQDGTTIDQARETVSAFGAKLANQHPLTDGGYQLGVEGAHRFLVASIRPALFALLGAVGFVLLIACTNVANLLLARSVTRQREIGLRMALGASRLRLARQLLAENLVLGLAAAGLGILFALWGIGPLAAMTPSNTNVPLLDRVQIDLPTLAFGVAAALATSLLFGMAPMLQLRGLGARLALARGSRGDDTARGSRVRSGLVVVEVALSLVLLFGAGLMVRTMSNFQGLGVGFEPRDLLVLRTSARGPAYGNPANWPDFYQQVSDRLGALPGVEGVAACEILPMFAGFRGATPVRPTHLGPAPEGQLPRAVLQRTTPGFFSVAGIPLLAGRGFDRSDRADAPPVGVISKRLAHRIWGEEDPIGQELTLGEPGDEQAVRIVGLVGDLRGLVQQPEPPPILYVPYDQQPTASMSIFLRTETPAADTFAAAEQAIWGVSRDVPVFAQTTLEQVIRDIEWQPRFLMQLLVAFALFALGLAAVGLYAVLAFVVAERKREIGVRLAVGAQRSQIVRLLLTTSSRLAVAGIASGIVVAWGIGRLLASQLYGIAPTDPATFVTVALLVGTVATVASLLPALTATRVDPVDALRAE